MACQLTDMSPAPKTDAGTWPLPSSPQALPFFTWPHRPSLSFPHTGFIRLQGHGTLPSLPRRPCPGTLLQASPQLRSLCPWVPCLRRHILQQAQHPIWSEPWSPTSSLVSCLLVCCLNPPLGHEPHDCGDFSSYLYFSIPDIYPVLA